jgi:hypothetical protein
VADDFEREVIYGRPSGSLRVFVSSQMAPAVLTDERRAAADTINSSPLHHAWCWEDDAPTGANHAETECVGYAGSSDGIVLLLGVELTRVTRAEYEAARRNGAERFIFLRQSDALDATAKRFVEGEQKNRTVTRGFANLSELRTSLTSALLESAVRSSRKVLLQRRDVELGSMPPPTSPVRMTSASTAP